MAEVLWTTRARATLRNAVAYIAKESPRAARHIHAAIDLAGSSLGELPRRGRHGQAPNTLELLVAGTPYRLVYEVIDTTVWILDVVHAKQDEPDPLH